MYIEGPDFGSANYTEELYGMFGCTFIDHGTSSSFGNVVSLEGQDGSIGDGMNYDYLYQQGPDNFVDEIGEDGGTIFFKSQESKGRAVCYSGLTDNYRTIHATFIFGALTNGTNTKLELMNSYMDYLAEPTGIEEYGVGQDGISFSVFPNPLRMSANINFSLEQSGKVVTSIYNTAGQLVSNLLDAELTKGTHSVVWNGKDYNGRKVSSGTYMLRIELDGQVAQKTIVLVN